MGDKACTIRTRKFLVNKLLGRKQFVSSAFSACPRIFLCFAILFHPPPSVCHAPRCCERAALQAASPPIGPEALAHCMRQGGSAAQRLERSGRWHTKSFYRHSHGRGQQFYHRLLYTCMRLLLSSASVPRLLLAAAVITLPQAWPGRASSGPWANTRRQGRAGGGR